MKHAVLMFIVVGLEFYVLKCQIPTATDVPHRNNPFVCIISSTPMWPFRDRPEDICLKGGFAFDVSRESIVVVLEQFKVLRHLRRAKET